MELTIEQALQQGVTAHKEGNLQDAERLYRAVLKSQPTHPDATPLVTLNFLGTLYPLFGQPPSSEISG